MIKIATGHGGLQRVGVADVFEGEKRSQNIAWSQMRRNPFLL